MVVTVTDVAGEAPGAPAAPAVAAASVTSLTVSWTAPSNAGPAITDYDYRYRVKTPQGDWTEVTGTESTALSQTVSGLAEDTVYEVQVRATNDEGTGAWSASGSGATDANTAPTVVKLVLTPDTISEDGGKSTVSATVTPAAATAFTVEVTAAALAPAVAADFTLSGSTLSFAAHATDSTGTVTITARDNDAVADNKSVTVAGSVTGATSPPAPAAVTLTIYDDESPAVVTAVAISSTPGDDERYAIDDFIEVRVDFDRPVSIDPTPVVTLYTRWHPADYPDLPEGWPNGIHTLGATYSACYAGGAGTSTLSFRYAVREGQRGPVGVRKIFTNALPPDRDGNPFDLFGTGRVYSGPAGAPVLADIEIEPLPHVKGMHEFDGVRPVPRAVRIAADRSAIIITFSEELAATTAAATAFEVTADAVAVALAGAPAVAGHELTLRLASALSRGQEVTVDYTNPAHDPDWVAGHDTAHYLYQVCGLDFASDAPDHEGVAAVEDRAGNNARDFSLVAIEEEEEIARRGGDAVLPALAVADARATEGEDRTIDFRVTLDRAVAATVTVAYATEDGTATAGEDYTAAAAVLTFAPGATAQSIAVTVLDDARDEGAESFTLRLRKPVGATLADATATGTIENDDALPRAWLARFGRTAAGHVLAAVGERLDGATGSQATIAGHRLSRPAAADRASAQAAHERAWDEWLRDGRLWEEPRSMAFRELLAGSSFDLAADTAAGEDAGGQWTVWGRGAWSHFAGADATAGALTVDGDVVTVTLGADYRQDRLLGGLALAYSAGHGSYRHASGDAGQLRSTLASVHPYLRVALHERLALWGLFGYGPLGHLVLTESAAESAVETDLGMLMGAFGAHATLLAAAPSGGFELAAKGDGLLLRMRSAAAAGLVATAADVSRWRLLLHASYRFVAPFGGVLTPALEVGGRYDGGAAETGAGLVLGGSLSYALPAWGLTLSATGQGLLLHQTEGFREWSAGGSLRFAPGTAGRGLTLRVAPSWGHATTTGGQDLWSLPDASGLPAAHGSADAAGRLDAELGYGLDAPGGHGLLTPYAGLALDGGQRTWRLGARLELQPSFNLSLAGTRRESAAAAPEHTLTLRGTLHH